MTSWAAVYDIYYLDKQTKKPDETSDEFATRIQLLIANAIGKPAALFDGSVWYKPAERQKYRNALQEKCAWEVSAVAPAETFTTENEHKKVTFGFT